MLPRPLILPALLAASVAVPYAATNGPEVAKDFLKKAKPASAPAAGAHDLALPAASDAVGAYATPQGPGSLLHPTLTPLEGPRTHSVAEVMRLDVTKEWVYDRWSRKSTTTSDLDWYGVRVPLVTGTSLQDLAGSLTYYFGHDGLVHKISFRGRTGDTTQLVHLVAGRFGLQRQASLPGEQLFELRRGDDVISRLRTRPASVLWKTSPHDSFDVELDLQRPETGKPLVVPAVQAPAAPQAGNSQVVASPAAGGPAESAEAEDDDSTSVTDPDGWKVFFPRSRVPKPQVESLDERRRMW